MKRPNILTWILLLNFTFCSLAFAQDENSSVESSESIRQDGDSKNSFTLDPMEENSSPADDIGAIEDPYEERNESTATQQYTLSPQGESVPAHKASDDIKTLAGATRHQGGFGGISFKTTQFNDKYLVLAGFRAGWIVNRSIAIGVDGYGVIPSTEYAGIDPVYNTRVVGGYGGLTIEPIIFSNQVVHVTFPISGGAGWLGYLYDWEEHDYDYDDDDDLVDGDVFWYIEPAAAIEVNVTKFLRVNMGASYRITQDFELVNTESDAFDGMGYFLTFKFGRF